MSNTRRIFIVGGGASGVLLACHLLRDPNVTLDVTLVERRAHVARGIAYSTNSDEHVLNVRAANMSAYPDEPDHFLNWLRDRKGDDGYPNDPTPFCFVPRKVYGDYLADLLTPLLGADAAGRSRLTLLKDECTSISPNGNGVELHFASGRTEIADIVALATGHDETIPHLEHYTSPWVPPREAGIGELDSMLIMGTGLTMVDYVLSLIMSGHRGPITALSRRGLLPMMHRQVAPVKIENVPIGASAATTLKWLRGVIRTHQGNNGDWREVVDGLRPFNQKIWQGFSLADRKRFLEHARAWWDVHRHRMAPEAKEKIVAAIASGQLSIIAAKVNRIDAGENGVEINYRQRGADKVEVMRVDKIVQCAPVLPVPAEAANPVITSLLEAGLMRRDALGICVDVAPNGAAINRDGHVSTSIFGVGPITRAALWEITAVPDIRTQCAQLAAHIIGRSA